MIGKKDRIRALALGAFSMVLFMIGDWLLDAVGEGDSEIGLIAHSNWDRMAMCRFAASAAIAVFAVLFTYLGSREAISISREVRGGSRTGRIMDIIFRLSHVILITYGGGFHAILCLFPITYKTILGLGGSAELAASAVNDTGMQIIIPLMILYIVCDIGVSVAWYYMVLSGRLRLPKASVLCCPLSSLVIDFALKAIPLQFFKDFTVAFESLGWLLMFAALAVHTANSTDAAERTAD